MLWCREADSCGCGREETSPTEIQTAEMSEDPHDLRKVATSVDFTVRLERPAPQETLNIQVTSDASYKYLVISLPTGTALRKYQLANPGKQVRPGDQIISVNGTSGDAHALIERLSELNAAPANGPAAITQEYIELVLRRYTRFAVVVEWTEEDLGLKFNKDYKVVAIQDGMVKTAKNALGLPSLDVHVGDELVEVNGETVNFDFELFKRKAGTRLRLVFVRPGIEEYSRTAMGQSVPPNWSTLGPSAQPVFPQTGNALLPTSRSNLPIQTPVGSTSGRQGKTAHALRKIAE